MSTNDKPKWTEVVTVFLTIAIAVAAFLSAYIFQGQLKEARRATNIATNEFRLDEQARIKITSREAGWNPRMPRDPLVANYDFLNSGKTPAEIIGYDRHVSLVPFTSNVENLTFPAELPKKESHPVTVFSEGGRRFSVMNYSFSSRDETQVERGNKLIVSWGCIEYKDTFGSIHWTDFCDVCQPAPNGNAYASCAYKCQRNAN